MPARLSEARRLFLQLENRRATSFHFAAPSIVALGGGGAPQILTLPPIAQPVAVGDIEILARLSGHEGEDLLQTVTDVILFDDAFVAADMRAALRALETLRR